MTPTEHHILAVFLRACPSDALEEVVIVPLKQWDFGVYSQAISDRDETGFPLLKRCLVAIANGEDWSLRPRRGIGQLVDTGPASNTFDTCCARDGLRATVEAVQEMARRVLADRDAKGVL